MGTNLQKNLAHEIVKNLKAKKPKNKKELLVSSGYDETTAETNPQFVIEQKGVKEELELLGFSEDRAKKVVSEIMNNPEVDPNARLKATDQTFKVHGSYAPEKKINLNIAQNISNKKVAEMTEHYEAKLKQALLDEPDGTREA